MRIRSRYLAWSLATLLIGGGAASATAQCALCAKNAEFAGAQPGDGSRAFARAGIVLLVPVLGATTALGVWMRRHGVQPGAKPPR